MKNILTTIILAATAMLLVAEPIVTVTKKSPTSIEITAELAPQVSTVEIGALIRELKDRYVQKAKEIEDRNSEIKALESKIAKALEVGVEVAADAQASLDETKLTTEARIEAAEAALKE